MNKEKMEELLTSYGVAFTDVLADRLLELINQAKKDAVDEYKETLNDK